MDKQQIIPEYTIYNNPEFGKFIADYFGWKFIYFRLLKNNTLITTLPFINTSRKWTSIPFGSVVGTGKLAKYLPGNIIDNLPTFLLKLANDQEKQIQEIPVELQSLAPENIKNTQHDKVRWEFRGFRKMGKFHAENKVLSILPLKADPNEQMENFSSNLRRKIRKSTKNGLEVKTGGSELLDDFYKVYFRNCHRRLGSLVLRKDFYEGLINAFSDGKVYVLVTYHSGKAIGGSILITYKDYWENILFATRETYNHLYPSYLLNWTMINTAIENKGAIYSFGRSEKNSGVHFYKKQWGTSELPIYWNYSHQRKTQIRDFTLLAEIWKRLPSAVCQWTGPALAKKVF